MQLHAEFDSYLQYALGISTGEIDTVPIRYNLENASIHNYPTIPDLVTSFYQLITQFENFEIELANEDIQRQAKGGHPLDKNRPWSHKPFGCRTRSQNSYVRQRVKQDEFIGR